MATEDVTEQIDLQLPEGGAEGPAKASDLIDSLKSVTNKESESLAQSTMLDGTGSRKKPKPFDAIREDMMALKLDVKVGRQKERLDEKERLRQLETQRLREKSKTDSHKLMQSEWSEGLLIKNKRRKFVEEQNSSPSDNRSISSQDLQDANDKDWPEHWKKLPNFKNAVEIDPVMQAKWKNRPNFKVFRKSAGTGMAVESRRPTSLVLDGALDVKQEEAAQK
ncbi:hypothetical protein BGZ65_012787, partial [Modicella reniformis]